MKRDELASGAILQPGRTYCFLHHTTRGGNQGSIIRKHATGTRYSAGKYAELPKRMTATTWQSLSTQAKYSIPRRWQYFFRSPPCVPAPHGPDNPPWFRLLKIPCRNGGASTSDSQTKTAVPTGKAIPVAPLFPTFSQPPDNGCWNIKATERPENFPNF